MAFGFGSTFSDYLNLPWEQARDFLKEELEQLKGSLLSRWSFLFDSNDQLTNIAIAGDGVTGRRYIANTGPHHAPKWDKAVYNVSTDDIFITGGPITDSGTISASNLANSALWEALQRFHGGATL